MNFANTTDHELLKMSATQRQYGMEIRSEWKRRHEMNFPFKLTHERHIKNCLINALVGDRECDQVILEQANELRSRRKIS